MAAAASSVPPGYTKEGIAGLKQWEAERKKKENEKREAKKQQKAQTEPAVEGVELDAKGNPVVFSTSDKTAKKMYDAWQKRQIRPAWNTPLAEQPPFQRILFIADNPEPLIWGRFQFIPDSTQRFGVYLYDDLFEWFQANHPKGVTKCYMGYTGAYEPFITKAQHEAARSQPPAAPAAPAAAASVSEPRVVHIPDLELPPPAVAASFVTTTASRRICSIIDDD